MIQTAAGVIGLVASALILTPGSASAERAVASSQAGTIEVWGTTTETSGLPANATYPAEDGPWTAVTFSSTDMVNTFGINAAGILKRLSGADAVLNVPADLADVQVSAVSTYAGKVAAVTADGGVRIWGNSRGGIAPQTLTPATLGAQAIDVAVSTDTLVVLLEDGRVGTLYAGTPYEITEIGPGVPLDNAVQVAVLGDQGYARLDGGGVASWMIGGPVANYPAEVSGEELADPVIDFAVGGLGVVAVTQAGEVYVWNNSTGAPLDLPLQMYPEDDVSGTPEGVVASTRYFGVHTSTDEFFAWGQFPVTVDYPFLTTVPESVDGQPAVAYVGARDGFAAIVTGPQVVLAEATKPTIAGSPTVGSTLTATPATFTGSPESITNVWLADNAPIEGPPSATLLLTPEYLGKSISYRSTAYRGNDTPVESLATPVGPVIVAPPQASASTTTVGAAASTYGAAGTVTVTVGNAAGKPVAGTVILSGAGAAQSAAVVGGKATFALDKALTAGGYTLTAAYSGSTDLTASTGAAGYTVAKAKTKRPAFKTNKASTSKKKGKATVTVGTNSGLAKASGKATVTLKKGKTTKRIKVNLSNGKRSISLPKLKKGTWKVQVSYSGDKNYVAQKSKSYKLKIKK